MVTLDESVGKEMAKLAESESDDDEYPLGFGGPPKRMLNRVLTLPVEVCCKVCAPRKSTHRG